MVVDTAPARTGTGKHVGHTPVKKEDSTWTLPHGNEPMLRYTLGKGHKRSVSLDDVLNSSSWPQVLVMVLSLLTAWPVFSHGARGTNIFGGKSQVATSLQPDLSLTLSSGNGLFEVLKRSWHLAF